MIPKLAELFSGWFRSELYGSEDRIKALILQQGEQHDFAEMFATLEDQIVERVVAEMGKTSFRVVGRRQPVKANIPTETPDEG